MGPINPSTLVWDAPQTNADGTKLTDLKEYHVYTASSTAGPWTQVDVVPAPNAAPLVGETAQSSVSKWGALAPGQWYASVQAFDLSGRPSALAVPAPFVVGDTVAPSSPVNLRFL